MESECSYYNRNGFCYYGMKKKNGTNRIHVGTEDKLDILENYAEDWIWAILTDSTSKYKQYSGAIFCDCMCSSGKYVNKSDEVVKGTSLRVLSILNKVKQKYPTKELRLIINDKGVQEIKCQKCRIGEIEHKDIYVEISNKDVRDFLLEMKNGNKISDNYHLLLFYDPFKAEIYWDEIGEYLKGTRFDLILTHFHQNDTQRVISNSVSQEVKNKYQKTYGIDFEDLKLKLCGQNSKNKNLILRELLIENMKKIFGDNAYITCLPVFNKNNKDVYDIVLYSKSEVALEKFKNVMYKVMSKRVEEYDNFDQEEFNLSCLNENQTIMFDMKDIFYFYSIKTFVKIIAINFSGQSISKEELTNFIKHHVFIPTNIKRDIDRWLKSKYDVEVYNINKEKHYRFPIVGEKDIL